MAIESIGGFWRDTPERRSAFRSRRACAANSSATSPAKSGDRRDRRQDPRHDRGLSKLVPPTHPQDAWRFFWHSVWPGPQRVAAAAEDMAGYAEPGRLRRSRPSSNAVRNRCTIF